MREESGLFKEVLYLEGIGEGEAWDMGNEAEKWQRVRASGHVSFLCSIRWPLYSYSIDVDTVSSTFMWHWNIRQLEENTMYQYEIRHVDTYKFQITLTFLHFYPSSTTASRQPLYPYTKSEISVHLNFEVFCTTYMCFGAFSMSVNVLLVSRWWKLTFSGSICVRTMCSPCT